MRYSLFENKEQADSYAKEVEAACDAASIIPPIKKFSVWIEHLQRYVVSMEVEPPTLRGEIRDTIAQPVTGE